ncbi:thioredoxin family protein [Arthrobacter sp.]|uniref:thioredoxin family protein n=1 Tax=Arthrobacter sp. TaxID=1667 RepID=UPI003A91E935
MRIELLCIDGCPNSDETQARIVAALAEAGAPDVEVVRTVVDDAAGAAAAFAGSPTITLDEVDLFPGAAPVSELSCRVYQTPNGLAGLPTVEQLRDRIRERIAG